MHTKCLLILEPTSLNDWRVPTKVYKIDFSRNFFLLVGLCRRLFLKAPFIGQIEADLSTEPHWAVLFGPQR